jgi:small subunit ribosomal protein S9
VTEPTGTESVEEGQPVTTPEPEIEAAAEEAAVEVEAAEIAADDSTEIVADAEAIAADADADEFDGDVEIAAAEIPAVFSDRPIQTVGRRKEAVVRVRLLPGTGAFRLNGKSLEDYFPNKLHQQLVRSPFTLLDIDGRFDVIARIHGGGISGQAGALRMGISRALNEIDRDSNRPQLKKAGFLTRDDRAVERKKAGLKKARKAPQYSKR